ncbi:hypothetical protein BDY21DRAFT_295499 [Lineolata rhizophorae]|uniref:ATP12-domain-containing protein n=1 Tax=Lineolata rhizophorae TaxID=578093 RepID=A0A6A6PDT9_9PEZI|nr:hypothetical protein BDY21DRAFT_295499 [Lineolata rhizophorae]
MDAVRRASIRAARPRPAALPPPRCLHTSPARSATPLHPTTPGPPPKAPTPIATPAQDRIARKAQQADLLRRGQAQRPQPGKPAGALQRRFWRDVSVQECDAGLQVHLDSRPVRTAAKRILTIPPSKRQLAAAVALEWDQLASAQQALKQHYIPLTSLVSRALDIRDADANGDSLVRNDAVGMMMKYFGTDTLLCWAPERGSQGSSRGDSLRQRQVQAARPILDYLTTHVWPGADIVPALEEDNILPKPQPERTRELVQGWLSALPAFELAGLERAVLASKSLLVAVRLLAEWSEELSRARATDGKAHGARFGIEEAAEACSVEVRWQTELWGEVEDTHDVEKEDLRRQLGSVVLLVGGSSRA